jgi:hypothetical protein
MQLKRRVMDPRARDDISEALAFNIPTDPDAQGQRGHYRFVPQYIYNYYPTGLRERVYGPHSRELVGVTRYYPRCSPPVAIDFEPPHPDPWFREEKLQFFLEQGIAYVPITLRDQLTAEAFVERVEAAKRLAVVAKTEAAELKSLASVGQDIESWLQDPGLTADIDKEVLEVLQRENEARGKPLTGGARTRHLAHVKTRIIMQLREDLKRGRLMDPFQRHRQSAPSPQ